ncbi:hypothetical protein Pmani_031598 [Petrolisthes manimaculis]|uniref:Uncharacterized protein n=1 Tax=Petrolisthes manimaculis TaxID=1843537 RepID=A0AAE1TSH1_9EUCA|nr:hypothetical protein Pmani_031598 [Petrolisthes manimaculis]
MREGCVVVVVGLVRLGKLSGMVVHGEEWEGGEESGGGKMEKGMEGWREGERRKEDRKVVQGRWRKGWKDGEMVERRREEERRVDGWMEAR